MYLTNQIIKDAIRELREVREHGNDFTNTAIANRLSNAIAVLESIEQKSQDVVKSCLKGHGQAAEEFAYQLSGV